ncbi:Methyltransferase domain-containing protein [Colletotrichum higginsianum IMI 349063]|uniref:Methyltransferase domain-containing protein n=1 Tax=Colletotrichum higginsianum (strain IMI 349063) TaxID=759273 RepID=A0A1B7YME3_COLHI|nr:Methyltransferase domain-containing protein [Colletotrichum higginsianum IMI 349063]OBR13084.1 Methyltransferase domain-containing protein [Colletotrichum higginsianum IMI 349063]
MSTSNDAPGGAATEQANVQTVIEARIDPDENTEDRTSDIGSEISSNSSVSSSVYEFRIENGRRYQTYREGSESRSLSCFHLQTDVYNQEYHYPIDERESERLGEAPYLPILTHLCSSRLKFNVPSDLQHWLCLGSFRNKLGLAPPNDEGSSVKRVLDLGTGTGLWAIEFGDEHPEAEVIGVDIVPPQSVGSVPPNVLFEIDDIDETWTYSQPFDYIHSRMMTSSISDWKKYLQKCFDHLEPNGYLELQEADLFPQSDDGTLKPDAAIIQSCENVQKACTIFGRPFASIPDLATIMTEVGFEDVVLTKNKWPMNSWPKDQHYKTLGAWSLENYLQGIEGWTMPAFTKGLGWTKDQVQVFLIDVRNEMKDRTIHAYWPVYSIYGRKPVPAPDGTKSQYEN